MWVQLQTNHQSGPAGRDHCPRPTTSSSAPNGPSPGAFPLHLSPTPLLPLSTESTAQHPAPPILHLRPQTSPS